MGYDTLDFVSIDGGGKGGAVLMNGVEGGVEGLIEMFSL